MINLQLPYPPTLNNLFKNDRKGRVKTEAYNAWLAKGLVALRGQRLGKRLGSPA